MLLCSVWSVDTADPPLMSSASVAVSGRYLATIQGATIATYNVMAYQVDRVDRSITVSVSGSRCLVLQQSSESSESSTQQQPLFT